MNMLAQNNNNNNHNNDDDNERRGEMSTLSDKVGEYKNLGAVTSNCVECTGDFVPLSTGRRDGKSYEQFTGRVKRVHVAVTASQVFSFAAYTRDSQHSVPTATRLYYNTWTWTNTSDSPWFTAGFS